MLIIAAFDHEGAVFRPDPETIVKQILPFAVLVYVLFAADFLKECLTRGLGDIPLRKHGRYQIRFFAFNPILAISARPEGLVGNVVITPGETVLRLAIIDEFLRHSPQAFIT